MESQKRNRISDTELQFIESNVALIIEGVEALKRAIFAKSQTDAAPYLVEAATIFQKLYRNHLDYKPDLIAERNKEVTAQASENLEISEAYLQSIQQQVDELWHTIRDLRQVYPVEFQTLRDEVEALKKQLADVTHE